MRIIRSFGELKEHIATTSVALEEGLNARPTERNQNFHQSEYRQTVLIRCAHHPMKLHYYKFKDGVSNFGDAMNPWLWKRILPGIIDEDDSVLFVGIGTLLNDNIPRAPRTIVFGTGVGYGSSLPIVDDTWKIYCVRGPLSAHALGLPADAAVTDPAVLAADVDHNELHEAFKYSFMPHIVSARPEWELICLELGFGYIDPQWSVAEVLTGIRQTEVLITEALHGAVVADALRIPWIAVQSNDRILPFKWKDWCASIEVNYEPKFLPPYWFPRQDCGFYRSSRNWARRKRIELELFRIALRSTPKLSTNKRLTEVKHQLWARLEMLKNDVESGYNALRLWNPK